jgi:FkbM family methyltransferase
MDIRTFVNGGIPIKKAIHVGAAKGNQVKNYVDSGVELVIWVEPQLQIFNQLIKNTISFPITNIYLPLLCSDIDGQVVDFHITNNSQSSSFMTLGNLHKQTYPHIKVIDSKKLLTTRFDTYYANQNDFLWEEIDMITIDCQGADLKVLKGFGDLLKSPNLKAIQSEVNFGEMYENNPTKEELKQYVESFGFNSAYWFMVDNNSWGDLGWTKF